MKKYTAYKTIHLIVLLAAAAVAVLKVLLNSEVYHQVAIDPAMRLLSIILWGVLIISFLFIFLDFVFFFGYRKEYREMEYAAHSDPVSGIANRFSCDMIIEKYLDRPVPQNLGAMMFDLTNIQEVNKVYGHLQGNMVIRDFSNILTLSSDEKCFVGRNGGNKFLAIFENATRRDMDEYLVRVDKRVQMHNSDIKNSQIVFSCGSAMNEPDVTQITELISLANRRSEDMAKKQV